MAIPLSSAAATSLTAKTNAAKALLLSPGNTVMPTVFPHPRMHSHGVSMQIMSGYKMLQKQKMEKAIETVRSNLNMIRTGRANPAMLDWFEIEYNGSPMHLKSIAEVSAPDGSSIIVQPFEKSRLKAIEKAIVKSYLDFTPNNDGEVIKLTIPPLTSKRRKELPKIMAKQVEEGKNAIRNIRREGLKAYEKLEKEKKLSKDNVKDLSSDLQKLTDEYIKKIDAIYKQDKELLEKV